MDRFEGMQVFVRVAELQSFTRAAESLSLPKATVSTAVQDLEALVNVRLLNRTTRRVQLTPEGSSFYERCKQILSDLDETENLFRDDTAVSGKVRVDMTVSMARRLVIPALPKFLERFPQVEVELSSTDRRIDLIREGVDCVVRSGSNLESGLAERDLGQMSVVNCASPSYLKLWGIPKSLEDLKHHRLIHYSQNFGGKPDGFEYFDGEKFREVKMSGSLTVNSTDSYEAACLSGLGITQSPRPGVADHLESGRMVEILPQYKAAAMPLRLVYPHRRLLAKRVRVFIDWLEPLVRGYCS